jgi:dTDP-4-amino-4,6-dideoxygalactose transaminase
MSYQIYLSSPVFGGNEKLYTEEAIRAGNLATSGDFIPKFERQLAASVNAQDAIVLNSGTSAIHLGLILLGVGSGDEVICQSFTFCASANPIVYLGATPIFVDSELNTWNISPEVLEDTILSRMAKGKKPKAIILVHLFGMPARLEEILEISKKYDIPILEDAAEALGSTFQGQACGTFGKIGIFSFNGNKIITSGSGGALMSSDPILTERARYLALQARENLPYYQHNEVGFNYKMNNLSAAVGLAQLEQLDLFIEKRVAINSYYKELLGSMSGIKFQEDSQDSQSNYWLSAILIDKKATGFSNEQLRDYLIKQKIESRFLWKPLHLQPSFKDAPYYGGKNAADMFEKGLCLPSSASLNKADQERISEIMQDELIKIIR